MAAPLAAFLIATAFLTATLSGIFGMAGGLVLMGALAFVLPVSAAFVTHGLLQLVANGWRAVLHRKHISWPILLNYTIAAAVAAGCVALVAFTPSQPLLFLLLGLVPMLVWLPKNWVQLDASRPAHALISGFLVTGLNLTAGVAGRGSGARLLFRNRFLRGAGQGIELREHADHGRTGAGAGDESGGNAGYTRLHLEPLLAQPFLK